MKTDEYFEPVHIERLTREAEGVLAQADRFLSTKLELEEGNLVPALLVVRDLGRMAQSVLSHFIVKRDMIDHELTPQDRQLTYNQAVAKLQLAGHLVSMAKQHLEAIAKIVTTSASDAPGFTALDLSHSRRLN